MNIRSVQLIGICLTAMLLMFRGTGQAEEMLLVDFRERGFEYAIEKWDPLDDHQEKKEDGVYIHAPSMGGGGFFFPQAWDLSRYKSIRIKLKTLEANEAQGLRLVLLSDSEEGSLWPIDLGALTPGEWASVKLDLRDTGSLASGKSKNVDLKNVQQLQVMGDFSDSKLSIGLSGIEAYSK